MSKRPSLLGMVEKKPAQAAPASDPAPQTEKGTVSAKPLDDTRTRVIVRLNLEAVEALEEISRDMRRSTGRAVPIQRLMEEAVELLLRQHGKAAVVLPAPTKRGR